MKVTTPHIGFDRFIHLDWVTAAMNARAGTGSSDEVTALLAAASASPEVRKKTRTVLNRLWLEPWQELADYADRGIAIYKQDPLVQVQTLTWGMAIATYPFFGRVAELVGRLSALQGDCASAEIHRRMSEIYGEREGTSRTTNMVLQSLASWGVIERIQQGKRLVRKGQLSVTNDEAVTWLVEGAVRYAGRAVSVDALSTMPVLFPFTLDRPVAYLISTAAALDVRTEGGSTQLVRLRSA